MNNKLFRIWVFKYNEECKALQLRPRERKMLKLVERHDRLFTRDAATILDITTENANITLGRLFNKGYVRRRKKKVCSGKRAYEYSLCDELCALSEMETQT